MARIAIISDSHSAYEYWDDLTPKTVGIGGSETSHVEMAIRLAQLGNEVVSFVPLKDKDGKYNRSGVEWRSSFKVNPIGFDLFIIYRSPRLADFLPLNARAWLICQDVDYKFSWNSLNTTRGKKFEKIFALCNTHLEYFKNRDGYSKFKSSFDVTSNGIRSDEIAVSESLLEELAIPRNPFKLIYASSPDRGLEFLLQIFPRVKEIVPQAELHVYYGFNNIDKTIESQGVQSFVYRDTQRVRQLLNQPGVVVRGRMGQEALKAEWLTSSLWVHPSNFSETSCITCMDAQASGAIPVTSPIWAVAENVRHGVFIDGDLGSELVRSRYVLETVKLLLNPERQEAIRKEMMPWARKHFDWNNFAIQWDRLANAKAESEQVEEDFQGVQVA